MFIDLVRMGELLYTHFIDLVRMGEMLYAHFIDLVKMGEMLYTHFIDLVRMGEMLYTHFTDLASICTHANTELLVYGGPMQWPLIFRLVPQNKNSITV